MMLNEQENRWFGDSSVGERFPAWTRGNAADVFPDPVSPLGQSLVMAKGMSPGLRDAYIEIGALSYDEFEDPENPDLFKIFGGYSYNPLTLTRVLGARMPGATPEMIDKAFFDDRDDVPEYQHQAWHDSPRHEASLGESMAWAMSTDSLPKLDADKQLVRGLRETRPDLKSLSDAALHARARAIVAYVQQTFENAMAVSSLSSLGTGAIGAICEALGDPTMAVRLLAGIEVDSGEPSHAMWVLGRTVAKSKILTAAFAAGPDEVLEVLTSGGSEEALDFLSAFEEFLFRHGARGQNEYDPCSLSWELQPRAALAAIDLMSRSDESNAPSARAQISIAERDAVAASVRSKVAQDAETAGMFEAALQSAQLFLAGRERAKTNVVTAINEVRVALYEYADRLVERGIIDAPQHLFMVTNDELDQLRDNAEPFKALIGDRWTRYQDLFNYEPVFIVNGQAPSLEEMTPRAGKELDTLSVGDVLQGAAGSAGVASGRARVILDAADPMALEPGDILIAPQTDPSWVPLFVPAAGVIVNVGAQGSHAMIVCRELGIPCVPSIADGTDLIPDGAMVTVDGSAGTVTIDSLPA